MKPATSDLKPTALYAILFLFFIQLLAEFAQANFAYGLMALRLTPEVASGIIFLSPLLLLFSRKGISGKAVALAGLLFLAARVVAVPLETRGRLIVSALGVGAFMIFFPSFLRTVREDMRASIGRDLGRGLALAVMTSVLLRAFHSGLDISRYGWYQVIAWVLAAVAAYLLTDEITLRRDEAEEAGEDASAGATWRTLGLGLGISSALVLICLAFSAPNVMARWTGAGYPMVVSGLTVALTLYALHLLVQRPLVNPFGPAVLIGWNAIFVASLVATILVHQIDFPSDPRAYPLFVSPVSPLHRIPLALALLSSPIIYFDFMLLTQALVNIRPSNREMASAMAVGALFILLMVFGHAFTVSYAYIPVVGPLFRDKFWLVYLVPGVLLGLAAVLTSTRGDRDQVAVGGHPWAMGYAGLMTLIGVAATWAALLTQPRPPAMSTEAHTVKFLTYNIFHGFSLAGQENFDGQLALMDSLDADIIGLQETATNRITVGNSDVVRYFAERLNMDSYYGPKTVTGTFGDALLSRYPILQARTFYLCCRGEQTAAIIAQIAVAGELFNVIVTHLAGSGPVWEQESVLRVASGMNKTIVMGDFNFRPGSDSYQLTTLMLEDSWLLKWPGGINDRGLNPHKRIDQIFVSPDLEVIDAEYVPNTQSDHPVVTAKIKL